MSGLLSPDPRLRELTDLGLIAAGALLHTYVSGTPSTPLATYSDVDLTIPNANPIVASAGGLFGSIYLTANLAYKYVLTDALGNPLWSQDPVTASGVTGTGLTNHGVLLGTGSASIGATAVGATGTVLAGVSGADPTFQTIAAVLGVQTANQVLAGPVSGAAAAPAFRALTGADLTAPNGVRVLDRKVTLQDVVNTVVETTVYTFAVPGGTLLTTKQLRLQLIGDVLNNSGGSDAFVFRLKFGATTIHTWNATITNGAGANRRSLHAQLLLSAANATGAQISHARAAIGNNSGSTATGALAPANADAGQPVEGVNNAIAEDTTAAKTLSITFQHGTADPAISTRLLAAVLELLE